MIFDLLFVLVLLAMAALGAWRGAVVSGAGLLGLLLGYAGAVWAALHGSGWVADRLVVPQLVAPAIAGTIGFVVVWLLMSSAADVVVAWDRSRVEAHGRHFFDRGIGGLFGLARGGLIVVLLGLMVNWLDAGRDLGALDGLAALPDAEASAIAGASGDLVGGAVAKALSETGAGGEVAARIVARPGVALGSVQSILEDERLEGLFRDRLFWTLIQNDSIDYAMNRNAIRRIVKDPEMRGRFVDLGLVDEAARENSDLFRNTLAGVLEELAPRVERLHRDPEIQSLASDPEIIRLVQSGDSLALLSHPRIRKIVDRISAEP
jgi:membrane protein required for colicin V production